MLWIGDHYFQDAKTEGWFDAILVQVRSHPRAIRTMEYADHCDEVWSLEMLSPYPAFEDWRREADSYVDVDRLASRDLACGRPCWRELI